MDILDSFSFAERPVYEAKQLGKNVKLLSPSQERILFIDGGEGRVLETLSAISCKLRIAGVVFNGPKKESILTAEYDVLIMKRKGVEISSLPALPEAISASEHQERDLEKTAERIRKRLEMFHAHAWSKGIPVVVMDGTLSSDDPVVKHLQEEIRKGKLLLGIAKTTSLACEDGSSVTGALQRVSHHASYAVLHEHPLITVAKLHDKARSAFVIEANKESFGCLLPVSCDISFLGYPYPLILADQLARVSQEEVKIQKTRILVNAKNQHGLLQELSSKENHSILDSLRF